MAQAAGSEYVHDFVDPQHDIRVDASQRGMQVNGDDAQERHHYVDFPQCLPHFGEQPGLPKHENDHDADYVSGVNDVSFDEYELRDQGRSTELPAKYVYGVIHVIHARGVYAQCAQLSQHYSNFPQLKFS